MSSILNEKNSSKEEVENAFLEFIDSKDKLFFAHGINELPSRWQRCIHSNGGYFD
jgi:histone-lysine N-methyltransferase SETMAR